MKKEVSKQTESKETLSDVMKRYEASLSISLSDGFAHIKYDGDKMFVTWLSDEGYVQEEGQDVPFDDIQRIADFMRDMKELRLEEWTKSK